MAAVKRMFVKAQEAAERDRKWEPAAEFRRRNGISPAAVSCCLSTAGISLLDHPVPAVDFSLPHGRPTGHDCPAHDGVATFHTSETRPGWVPPLPRDGGVHPTG